MTEAAFDTTSRQCEVLLENAYCEQIDSRGIQWFAPLGDVARRECADDLGVDATGYGYWYCDENTGMFFPEEPDRSNCQEVWVGDVEAMVSLMKPE